MSNDTDQIKEILSVHLGYIKERFDSIDKKITTLTTDGCERGRVNSKAISELERVNRGVAQRAGAAAGGLITIISGVVVVIIEYIRKLPQ